MKRSHILLGAILLLAFAIRIYPIGANLPYGYWHDENNYIEMALRFGAGNFTLGMFAHGGLYQLLLLFLYGAYFGVLYIAGAVSSPEGFFVRYIQDPSAFFVIARAVSVFCGTGIAYLTYAIGSRLYTARVGLGAALFAAVSLLMVQMSCVALADMLAVFLELAAFLILIIGLERKGSLRLYAVASFVAGLSVAAKFYTLFGVAALFCGAVYAAAQRPHDRWRYLVKSCLVLGSCAGIGFIVGMPFLVLDIPGFIRDTFIRMGGEYIVDNPASGTWLFYFTHHLRNGLGFWLEALSLGGLIFAAIRHQRRDVLLLVVPVLYYLLIMGSTGYAYHTLPAIPFILLLGARLLDAVSGLVFGRYRAAAYALLAVAIVMPTCLLALKYVAVAASGDTRTEAREWIGRNVPSGSRILAEGYIATEAVHGVPLSENAEALDRDRVRISAAGGSGRIATARINLEKHGPGEGAAYDIRKADWIRDGAIERWQPAYVILSGSKDMPTGAELSYYIPESYFAERKRVRSAVSARYRLIASFLPTAAFSAAFPHLMDRDYEVLRQLRFSQLKGFVKGPVIEVYRAR